MKIPLIIMEMQIETTVRHHFTPTRMIVTHKKNLKVVSAGGCGDTGALVPCRGNVNRCCCGKPCAGSSVSQAQNYAGTQQSHC